MSQIGQEQLSDSDGEAGFTLVELLVAVALFGLLAALTFGNVRFGIKAWEIGSARAEQADQVATVQSLLRRIVGGAYPLLLEADPIHPVIDFDGSKDGVSFLSSAPAVLGGGGRFRFRLVAEAYQGRPALVLTSRPELENAQQAGRKSFLLTDIDSVEFSYLAAGDLNEPSKWQGTWVQRIELPKLIRLRVALHDRDARSWPDLAIAPLISVDVGCTYDQLTKRCRGR